MSPSSYLICGTPRTGSTLLCSLLTSTGVAGRPESYFREPDLNRWARDFGVPIAPDGTFDYKAFVDGAVRAGSTPNGVFAARIMWGTMQLVTEGIGARTRSSSDLALLEETFGPLKLIHHRREDVVEQAVSWARAEQTGYWQQGDIASLPPRFDARLVHTFVETIQEHEAGWRSWFDGEGVEPLVVTYEGLVADRRGTVERILDHIGVEPPEDWEPASPHERQADDISADWVRRYRGHC
jgi:LPS sulfotransferase NodH